MNRIDKVRSILSSVVDGMTGKKALQPLFSTYPNGDALVALGPQHLGIILVRTLPHSQHLQTNLESALRARYRSDEAVYAFSDAWQWLENNGYLMRGPGMFGTPYRVFTRKALALKESPDVRQHLVQHVTGKDLLHPLFQTSVWPAYLRAEYDTAVAEAFRIVEMSMRERAELPTEMFGERLVKHFFRRTTYRDPGETTMTGIESFFIGAFSLYRNRSVHGIHVKDSLMALQVLTLSSHMLLLVNTSSMRSTEIEKGE